MSPVTLRHRSRLATIIFDLLNPIPYGLFVGTLIFDIVYVESTNILWIKSAAWLVSIGLVFAVIPRIINLVHVWITSGNPVTRAEKLDFWLNLVAIAAAIANALVHSRDAFAAVPENVLLSVVTVALLAAGQIVLAFDKFDSREDHHE